MDIEICVDKKDSGVINRNLKKTLQNISVQKNGHFGLSSKFDIEIRKEIIGSKIKIKGPFDDKEMFHKLLFDSILCLKKKGIGNPDYNDLLSELKNKINAYIRKPLRKFIVLLPLHSTGGALIRKRWFNIQGTRFYKSDWLKVHNISGWKSFKNRAKDIRYLTSNLEEQILPMQQYFTPLIANVDARSTSEAFQIANKKYEIIRSILNLNFTFGKVTFQFGPPIPLGEILPPIFYGLFDEKGSYISLYFNEESYIYKTISLKNNDIEYLNRMIKRIDKMEEDIKSVFIDSLLKYVRALDTSDWRDAFLTLWQILENLSLSSLSSGITMRQISSRVKNLMGPTDILHKELIDSLVDTRNKLVHLGKFSKSGLMEVNFIKIIVDQALSNFYWLLKLFPSKVELEEFFQIATKNENELKRRKSIAMSAMKILQKSITSRH